MTDQVRIAIIGDFDRGKHSHWATETALFHAAASLDLGFSPTWVPTTELARAHANQTLARFDGVWASPGSPYASADGMLAGIEAARVADIPFLGTCGGFQYALIELTRNVLGIADADSAENARSSEHIVITPIACEVPNGPKLCGSQLVYPMSGSLFGKLCGNEPLHGEYFCSFETNAEFIPRWEAAGLRIAARGPDGEMRALELPDRRFFLATLFQPQLSSAFDRPHPIVTGFLRACAATKR